MNFYIVDNKWVDNLGFILQISVVCNISLFLCNMIHVRFFNNEANVNFYIKMQEIDRSMGIGVHKVINKYLRLLNNASVLLVLAIYCMMLLLFFNMGVKILAYVRLLCMYSIIEFEILFCINLSNYFVLRLRFINSIISNYL